MRLVCDERMLCPLCQQGVLVFRDHARRISRERGGDVLWLEIPRGRCPICRSIHRFLPVSLVPFKHYLTKVISEILDGHINLPDLQLLDHPCEMTIYRWCEWAAQGYPRLPAAPLYPCFDRKEGTEPAEE